MGSASQRATTRRGRALAVLIGTASGLLVAEALLRAGHVLPSQRNPLSGFHRGHAQLGWIGVPDYRARFRHEDFDVVVEVGPDGFRRPGHSVEAYEAGARRVAVLGDSFTWGWGVDQGEVVTDRLQDRLGGRVRIRNFGINAYGTGQQAILLDEIVAPWEPDEVLVLFFKNDLGDNVDEKHGKRPWFRAEDGRLVAENSPVEQGISSWLHDLSRRSVALSTIRCKINMIGARLKERRRARVAASEPPPDAEDPAAREPDVPDDLREVYELLLDRVHARCNELGARLRVAYVPERHEVEANEGAPELAVVCEACTRRGIDFLDLTGPLHAAWTAHPEHAIRARPLYLPLDGHWDAEGHEAVSDAIAEAWFPNAD